MPSAPAPDLIPASRIDELFRASRAGEAHLALAANAWASGNWTEVVERVRAAQEAGIDSPEAWHMLGSAWGSLGEEAKALECFLAAVRRDPQRKESLLMAARLYYRRGEPETAWRAVQAILQQDQTNGQALLLGARCLIDMQAAPTAAILLKMLRHLQPDSAEIQNLSGNAALAQGAHEEAEAFYATATRLDPQIFAVWRNLGHVYFQQKKFGAAAESYTRAAELEPHNADAWLLALHAGDQVANWSDRDEKMASLMRALDAGAVIQTPFALISKLDDPVRQLAATREYALRALAAAARPLSMQQTKEKGNRLRIGYLSGDIYSHATSVLIAEMLSLHDRGAFEVFLYHYGEDDGSALRQRVLRSADQAVDMTGMTDRQAAERIAADGIDILIDLKGWTTGQRLGVLKYRPAPLQMHYLGYPGTIGTDAIDYLVGDRFIAPQGSEAHYHEALLILPGCYQVNDRMRERAATPTRREAGLPEDAFVFADFNQPYKITEAMFAVWMRILAACPGSVLWLLDHNPEATQRLREHAAGHGIDPLRLAFSPKAPVPQHVARIVLADLVLDTFPVNGHTTTSDALWAGVPELAVVGRSFISRVAGSLLHAAGLPELACRSLDEYEASAIALYRDADLLRSFRARLERRESLPLFDTPAWVNAFERGLRQAWERHSNGLPPSRIDINDNERQENCP